MPIPTDINTLSTTPASNSPGGGENASTVDDYLRQALAHIATLRDRDVTDRANLASTAAGQGSDLVSFVGGGTVTQALSGVYNVARNGADATGAVSSRLAFQNAITTLTTLGGGTITGPKGDYLFDTSSEATCLLCTVPVQFDFPPGTRFFFSYYDLALINFVGVNGGGIRNVEFVFTGTRPGSSGALTASHFGFNGTGVISPPDFAAFVSILGSSNVVIDNVQWRGNDTVGTNLKEIGIQIAGGTSTGPNLGTGGTLVLPGAGAVYSSGNKVLRCKSNDVAFGVTYFLQDGLQIIDLYSDRYFSVAFVGAGHVIYCTGMSRGNTIRGIIDNSTQLFALASTTFAGASTFQARSLVNSVVDGVQSKRVEGLAGVFNNTSGSQFLNFSWRADRYPQETFLTNSSCVSIVPSDSTSVLANNLFANWVMEDLNNAGAARSANVSMIGNGGASAPSANIYGNVYDGVYITHYPDSAYGKSIIATYGQRERWRAYLNSRGSGTNKCIIQPTGSAAGLLAENVIDVTLSGLNISTFNLVLTNSAGSNTVTIHGAGLLRQQVSSSGMVAGDRYLCDAGMYSTRADQVDNVLTHSVVHALGGPTTVPTPAPGLTFVGSVLDFAFNASGVAAVTWPASFKKAVDGVSAAGKVASTRFICTDATTPVWSQVGGALTYN